MVKKFFLLLMGLTVVMLFTPFNVSSQTIDLAKTGQTQCYCLDDGAGGDCPDVGCTSPLGFCDLPVWPPEACATLADCSDPFATTCSNIWMSGWCEDTNCTSTTTRPPGQDGEYQLGFSIDFVNPRFTGDGTGAITDNLTGLVWLEDANCMLTNYPAYDTLNAQDGQESWARAVEFIYGINTGLYLNCQGGGNTDWRMPNLLELDSLLNYGQSDSAVWLMSQGFDNVMSDQPYYIAGSYAGDGSSVWIMWLTDGHNEYWNSATGGGDRDDPVPAPNGPYTWAVRGTSAGTAEIDLRKTGDTQCWYRELGAAGGNPDCDLNDISPNNNGVAPYCNYNPPGPLGWLGCSSPFGGWCRDEQCDGGPSGAQGGNNHWPATVVLDGFIQDGVAWPDPRFIASDMSGICETSGGACTVPNRLTNTCPQMYCSRNRTTPCTVNTDCPDWGNDLETCSWQEACILNSDVVVDTMTGLMWPTIGAAVLDMTPTTTQINSFQQALNFVDDMNTGGNTSGLCSSPCSNYGYTDWMLPNKKQMQSMLFLTRGDGNARWFLEEGFKSSARQYWTSTTDPDDPHRAFSISNSWGTSVETDWKVTTNLGRWSFAPDSVWPVRVEDNDGTPIDMENNAPNNGDGNDDGLSDALQANVTSVLSATGYVTVVTSGGVCTQNENVQTGAASPADPGFSYPLGVVGFQLSCVGPANMEIIYHGSNDLTGMVYRNYGSMAPAFGAPEWYELTGVTFGTRVIDGQTVATASFTINDNLLGDHNDLSDIIVSLGGPGLPAPPTAIPTMTQWGMVVFMLLAVAGAVYYLRRRRYNN